MHIADITCVSQMSTLHLSTHSFRQLGLLQVGEGREMIMSKEELISTKISLCVCVELVGAGRHKGGGREEGDKREGVSYMCMKKPTQLHVE